MKSPQAKHKTKCPTCHKPTVYEFRPFCSRRCSDIDLAKWLTGSFVIPGPSDHTHSENFRPQSSSGEEDINDDFEELQK